MEERVLTTNMGVHRFDLEFQTELEALLVWRRDVRHFRTDALPEGTVERLLGLATLAPSVGNSQPWRFVRIRSTALRENLAVHVDAEVARAGKRYDGEQAQLYGSLKLHGLREAPELIAVFSDESPRQGHGLGRATMHDALAYSTVLAIHTIWLAARAEGIGMGWVSILDPVGVSKLLNVPDTWRFIALLCIGYPEVETAIPELERKGWQARAADSVVIER